MKVAGVCGTLQNSDIARLMAADIDELEVALVFQVSVNDEKIIDC